MTPATDSSLILKRIPKSEDITAKKIDALPIPSLPEELAVKALALAAQIDPSKPLQVLNIGIQAQEGLARFSESLIQDGKLAEMGNAGELLTQLKTLVRKHSPESLSATRRFIGISTEWLPWGKTLQTRIDTYVNTRETLKPVLEFLEKSLQKEQGKAEGGITNLEALREQNKKIMDVFKVSGAALAIAYNKSLEDFNQTRAAIAEGGADLSSVGELRQKWNDLERLDRRRCAIETSIALANTYEVQICRIMEATTYNVEILSEARMHVVPAWNINISAMINALRAKDQSTLVAAFRQIGDQLVESTADLIADTESLQHDMQKRTFVAASVIAQANVKIADSIESALSKQLEASATREEGLKLIASSQQRIVNAMQKAGGELVAVAGTAFPANASKMDLAASLLD